MPLFEKRGTKRIVHLAYTKVDLYKTITMRSIERENKEIYRFIPCTIVLVYVHLYTRLDCGNVAIEELK